MNGKVAVVLVNYKGYARKYLPDCIESLKRQDFRDFKVLIVDNESSEETFDFIRETAPEAEIIRNERNEGFAGGNNAGMRAALRQGLRYIILFNIDTVIGETAVSGMVRAADAEERAGAVQARLMLWPDKERINSIGNLTHFLGFGFCKGYGEKWSPGLINGKYICYPSGASVLLKADVLKEVGLFDESLWMYNEDQDLGWRIWLAGWSCVLAEDAVVYHKYEFSRSGSKYYYVDRNRVIAILKNYHWLTLLLIAPAFLVMEAGLLLFSVKEGSFKEKMGVYKYFLNLKNLKNILKSRAGIQANRKIREKEAVKLFSGRIWYEEIDDVRLRMVNPLFDMYWKFIKLIMIW
ncbi:MAG: glycosyltransferase family 2 protein [Nitrospirota bacterium]